jgi:two-component system chemotaxis response regulator CheY
MTQRVPFVLLLAEDDEDLAFLFRRMFRIFEPRWHLEWARNGVGAVDYCMKNGLPEVVVTDLKMPGMDGFEILSWMGAQPCPHPTALIVYSSSDDAATRERCRQAGASEFISKNSDVAQLRELMRRILIARTGEPMSS